MSKKLVHNCVTTTNDCHREDEVENVKYLNLNFWINFKYIIQIKFKFMSKKLVHSCATTTNDCHWEDEVEHFKYLNLNVWIYFKYIL